MAALGLCSLVAVSFTPAVTSRLWTIYFSDGPRRRWWHWLLKPGFRHVSASAVFADRGLWIFVDPTESRLNVEVFSNTDPMTLSELQMRIAKLYLESQAILQIPSRDSDSMPSAIASPVTIIKRVLGIRSSAITPFGLYRALLARGAKVVEQDKYSELARKVADQVVVRFPQSATTETCHERL
jgi:hypothetical protein